jgi:hypothetical protein
MGVDFSVKHMLLEMSFLHNVEQQLGRMNRWNEYGTKSTCTIFPAFTRFTDEEINFRRFRYESADNFDYLKNFYKEKKNLTFKKGWYSQADMDQHYDWCVIQTNNSPKWEFIKTCGLFRTDASIPNGINGMYRDVDNRTVEWQGVEYSVPYYRLDKSGNLLIVPHEQIFC